MVSIDDAVIARYSHGGKHFELYVDPDLAIKVRDGNEVPLSDLLAAQEVFKDASSGDRASEESLTETFGTSEIGEVATKILRDGDIQLTTEQRKKMREKKKVRVVNEIARQAYNPQTKAPHTPQRIEQAMEDAGVNIDAFESVSSQVKRVIDALRPLLPISTKQLRLEITVPPKFTGKLYGVLKEYGPEKENWLPDGRLKMVLSIPAGVESDLYDDINDVSKGSVEIKRL